MIEKIALPEIQVLLENKRFEEIKKMLNPVHPEDISSFIEEIEPASHKLLIFRLLGPQKSIDVFEYLTREEQERLVRSMPSEDVKTVLDEMSPDARTALFEDMPAEFVKKLLFLLSPEERQVAIQLLNYPEDSVGRLITPDFVQLHAEWDVKRALEHIRKVGLKKETVYHSYVLDEAKRLTGVVSLRKLVLSDPDANIRDVMGKSVIKVNAYTDKEEAAYIFKNYDLFALPVVDKENKLLGIITFDDFVDVLEEETTEDFEKIAAVVPVDKPYMEAPFFEVAWKRIFWLFVLVVVESFSGIVMQQHSSTIQNMIALTFFLPILIATGGNAGTQSATMIIRGLATGDLTVKDFVSIIVRESSMGFVIGIAMGIFGLLRALMQQGNWLLSVTVGISMCFTVIIATLMGACLPIMFRKFKLDPALMSSPLIATIVDVVGVAVYFGLASLILGRVA